MPKLLILIGVILTLLIIAYLLFNAFNQPKVTKSGPIIFFGDSLTAGVGANAGEDFPSVVIKKLNLHDAFNMGNSGDTSSQGLSRLERDVLSKNPGLVVVEFSGNDFLQDIAPATTIENLRQMTEKIKATGSQVILIHIRFPQGASEYEKGFTSIASEFHIKVVWNSLDGIISKPELMSDFVHPNAKGYEIMASRVSDAVKGLLN